MQYSFETGFSQPFVDRNDQELGLIVRDAHEAAGASMGRRGVVHCLVHVVAERQILDIPEAAAALERLADGGLSRHDAVHMIGETTMSVMQRVVLASRGDGVIDAQTQLKAAMTALAA